MDNTIDRILKDNRHGATTLLKQALQYFINLNRDQLLDVVKSEVRRLVDHFQVMGLFQRLWNEVQHIHTPNEMDSFLITTLTRLNKSLEKVCELAPDLSHEKESVLTISHSSFVREVILAMNRAGRIKSVYCIRSGPAHEGEILARELSEHNIEIEIIEDDSYEIYTKEVDRVVLGCDLLTKSFFINKKGTKDLVLWANDNHIPVSLVTDLLRAIPVFEVNIHEVPLFEKVDYSENMQILCEKGKLNPKSIDL